MASVETAQTRSHAANRMAFLFDDKDCLLFFGSLWSTTTYLVSVAVMVVAVLLASVVPLRRATKVDPMIVLRYE